MNNANFVKGSEIHLMIIKGINRMINLLLKLGLPFKPHEDSQESTKYMRVITIKQDFEYFRNLIKHICSYFSFWIFSTSFSRK